MTANDDGGIEAVKPLVNSKAPNWVLKFTDDELECIRATMQQHADWWVLDYTSEEDLVRREYVYDDVLRKLGVTE